MATPIGCFSVPLYESVTDDTLPDDTSTTTTEGTVGRATNNIPLGEKSNPHGRRTLAMVVFTPVAITTLLTISSQYSDTTAYVLSALNAMPVGTPNTGLPDSSEKAQVKRSVII